MGKISLLGKIVLKHSDLRQRSPLCEHSVLKNHEIELHTTFFKLPKSSRIHALQLVNDPWNADRIRMLSDFATLNTGGENEKTLFTYDLHLFAECLYFNRRECFH